MDETADETESTADETWTCSNGHVGNAGKLCTECGEARELNFCPSCGYEFPEDAQYKYCPDCGEKLQ